MTGQVVVIAGAGPGLGRSLAATFRTRGARVAALSRTPARVPADLALAADLSREAEVGRALTEVAARLGPVDVYIHNAAALTVSPFLELQPADFTAAWHTSVYGAAAGVRQVLPSMLERRTGTLIFIGATASIKGGAQFAAFASAKFALRGLAQSLARELHPQGVHVAHVVLDGLMRGTASVARFGGREETSLDPAACARAIAELCDQEPGAWTHELDLRPMTETF